MARSSTRLFLIYCFSDILTDELYIDKLVQEIFQRGENSEIKKQKYRIKKSTVTNVSEKRARLTERCDDVEVFARIFSREKLKKFWE